jgi:hypothetical protein
LIFAREINDDLTSLVKKLDKQIDETTQKHKRSERFGVFVILHSDDAKMHQKLKDLVANGELKHIVLAAGNAEAEQRNKLAKEAALTVSVYNGGVEPRNRCKVTSNFVLKKGLTRQNSNAIFEAVFKALPR